MLRKRDAKIEEKESKDGYAVQIEATQRGKESADM